MKAFGSKVTGLSDWGRWLPDAVEGVLITVRNVHDVEIHHPNFAGTRLSIAMVGNVSIVIGRDSPQ